MRYVFLAYIFAAVLIVSIFGFRGHKFTEPPVEVFNDMDRQARVNFQAESDFFADGLGSRKPVAGTVPVGYHVPHAVVAETKPAEFGFSFPGDTTYYNSGRIGDYYGSGMPDEVREEDGSISEDFIKRGQQRFNISCAVCHGASGNGKGIVAYYGNGGITAEGKEHKYAYGTLSNIADFLSPAFADPNNSSYRSDGDVFNTITNGYGLMKPYGSNITVRDRWAIIAYIRTLQASDAASKPAEKPAGKPPENPAEEPAE